MSLISQSSFGKNVYKIALVGVLFIVFGGVSRAQSRSNGPCDIFGSNGTPCVAAYSTTRALYIGYNGPLYQVTRQSDNATSNIGLNSNGFGNAAGQDSFCVNTSCAITELYDQTSNHNNLTVAPPGANGYGSGPNGQDLPVNASEFPVVAGGQKVYGMYFSQGNGYRNDSPTGIAVNGQPEGVYMVTSGAHFNGGCCFDFGNAETSNNDTGNGHMDAINIICGSSCSNPAVGIDMENGIYGMTPVGNASTPFVTAMGANDGQNYFAVYEGNAQSGSLTTTGTIPLPCCGYAPMSQEGAIILGIGGDNSLTSIGSFFEGVMTQGAPSSSVMDAVQSNIVAVGYTPTPPPSGPTPGVTYKLVNETSGLCLDDQYSATAPGSTVWQYTCNGTNAQSWTVQDAGNGYFTITNQQSGLVLDDKYSATAPGSTVWQYTANGSSAQNWSFTPISNGYFIITNQASGLLLDDEHSATASGSTVWLYTATGTNAQNWLLQAN